MFKICVIGCGGMSSCGHGPSFAKYKRDYDGVVLAGCCDLDIEKAQTYMKSFGFEKCYTDYAEMIDENKPDVVSIITPVDCTCEIAADVMKKGCNIILEKPPGRNKAEIEKLNAIAKEYGVNVRTSFNRRYTPLVLELIRRIGETGEKIINITYQMYRYQRYENDFSTTAIHAIDVVKHIAGSDYKTVSLSYDDHPELGDNVKNIFLNGIFENGTVFQISLVPTGGAFTERVSVNTVGNTFFVYLPMWHTIDVPGRLLHVTEADKCQEVLGRELSDSAELFEVSGFYNENRLYFEILRAGGPIVNDLETAIQSVELEECVRHSIPCYEKK